jgi:glyoxylase-like metal-dependent hydrolase (beta-lactamase superfamily II)
VVIIELAANLHLFRFEVGQAYLWRDDDGLTLIDTGVPGSGTLIDEGIAALGLHQRELKRVVLTHFHCDHTGSAAEIRASSGAPTIAHRRDAPLIRGELPPPPAVLTDWERPLFERVGSGNLSGPPAEVDQEVDGGGVLDFGGGAHVIAIPGHTDGSIAVHLRAGRRLAAEVADEGVGGRVGIQLAVYDALCETGQLLAVS